MTIRRNRPWNLPDSAATPEHLLMSRRKLLIGGAALGAGAMAGPARAQWLDGSRNRAPRAPDPTLDLYPATRNERYVLDRPVTPEEVNLGFNNFYEFGSSKRIATAAQALRTRPWTIKVEGLVEKPFEIGIDDLVRKMALEERLYRLRCVEAWSMAIPWTGFPLAQFVALAKPLSAAKYVRFETFLDSSVAPAQRQSWYPWAYADAFTIEECGNELAFMVTGAYGKPLANQMGAPLRVVLPWKYGFKQPKSIAKVSFLDARPQGFWEKIQGREYGFWGNVNPAVPHPRWSQARERDIATEEYRPTQIFNGYGEYVAGLYKGIEGEKLFM